MIPAVSAAAYDAARHRTALVDRTHRGRIVVSGSDRATYLQGLLTNDISALKPGEGCYTAYLTAQGRMIADAFVYELGDVILLSLPGDVLETVLARLDQFVFSEDVQLGNVTESYGQLAIVGPQSAEVIAKAVPELSLAVLAGLGDNGNVRSTWNGNPVIVVRTGDLGERGFEVYVERARVADLAAAFARLGVPALDVEAVDTLRIEGGVPQFHRDMDEQTIPLEAGIESRAISFTKGCYVGQEVIIRVLHRGHGRVARKLVGLRLDVNVNAAVPPDGAVIRAGEREIGHVTSACWSPALGRPIALAYVHRDFVEPGTNVQVDATRAEVSALPFV
jgi:folate-binding protein YgfZ